MRRLPPETTHVVEEKEEKRSEGKERSGLDIYDSLVASFGIQVTAACGIVGR
jgi:hypothetical protein